MKGDNTVLEVVFGDSACGSLKMAQSYGEGEYNSGCVSVIITHDDGSEPTAEEIKAERRKAEEKERLEWENGTPMGGNPGNVIGFALGLSIGDISEAMPGQKRREAMQTLFSTFQNPIIDEWISQVIEDVPFKLDTVLTRVSAGEKLRIWYSDKPEDLCGFYWLMEKLNAIDKPGVVSAIKLPPFERRADGSYESKCGWGEVSPGEWYRYLPLEEPISKEKMSFCSSHWKKLCHENASLRAALNGQLMSVPANFYDGFIRHEIDRETGEFQEANIVGIVIGKYQLGISDGLIAGRIEEMVKQGELEAVTQPTADAPNYWRILKKR